MVLNEISPVLMVYLGTIAFVIAIVQGLWAIAMRRRYPYQGLLTLIAVGMFLASIGSIPRSATEMPGIPTGLISAMHRGVSHPEILRTLGQVIFWIASIVRIIQAARAGKSRSINQADVIRSMRGSDAN